MVLVCGLSAEWRVPIVEPHQRRSRPPGVADRTRARADARSPRRLPTAADRREGGRGRVSSVSLDGEVVVYGAISTFARPQPPETRLNANSPFWPALTANSLCRLYSHCCAARAHGLWPPGGRIAKNAPGANLYSGQSVVTTPSSMG